MIQHNHSDSLVQDCNNSSALAMELLQSCTKPSICKLFVVLICIDPWGHMSAHFKLKLKY